MFYKVALLLIGSASAIQRHHHSHHKRSHELVRIGDDPRCSSQGCFDNNKHFEGEGELDFEHDYKVPNLGVDHDIVST